MEVFILKGRIDNYSQLDELAEDRLSNAEACKQNDLRAKGANRVRDNSAYLSLQDIDVVGV
jgi:hypothetical protein